MNRKNIQSVVLCAALLSTLVRADGQLDQVNPEYATGFVTPSELSFTLTDVSLVTPEGMGYTVWPAHVPSDGGKDGGTVDAGTPAVTRKLITFRRSDPAFLPLDVATEMEVPEGRFIGINIGFENITAVVNGGTYVGSGPDVTQGAEQRPIGLPEDTHLCSNGQAGGVDITSAAVNGAITQVPAASWTGSCSPAARTLTDIWPGGGAGSRFPKPYCFSPDGSICQPGDVVITSATPTPSITILMDLYHALVVGTQWNAARTEFQGTVRFANAYPMVLMGEPGAAIHLEGEDQGAVVDASLIFSGEKALQGIQLNSKSSRNHWLNARTGSAFITVTKVPPGAPQPKGNMAFVAEADFTGTGTLKFPLTSAAFSRGFITLTGFNAKVGSPVSIACDDTESLGGYEWTHDTSGGFAHCQAMGTEPGTDYVGYVIRRIVDPGAGGKTVLGLSGCEGVADGGTEACVYDAAQGVTTFGTGPDGFN